MIHIFVFKLSNGKYFLYPKELDTENPTTETIFTCKFECELYYDFVKENLPFVSTHDILYNVDEYDIDKYVRKYMNQYGITNVRGGNYYQSVLSMDQTNALLTDMKPCTVELFQNIGIIYEELKNLIYCINTTEDAKNELYKYEKDWELYQKEMKEYHDTRFFQYLNKTYTIDEDVLIKINDMKSFINDTYDFIYSPDEYRELLIYLRQLYKIYSKLETDTLIDHSCPKLYLYQPNVVFDKWVFESLGGWKNIPITEKQKTEGNNLCEIFTYIYYKVINHIDQLTFDYYSYPTLFEVIYPRKLYYLKRMCKYYETMTEETSTHSAKTNTVDKILASII
jgi:hypothetical protein